MENQKDISLFLTQKMQKQFVHDSTKYIFSALFCDVMRICQGFDPTMNCVQSFTKTRQSDKGWESSSDLCKTTCNDMWDLSFSHVRKSWYCGVTLRLLQNWKLLSHFVSHGGQHVDIKGYWKVWIIKYWIEGTFYWPKSSKKCTEYVPWNSSRG